MALRPSSTSPTEQKKLAIAEATERKQAELDPAEIAARSVTIPTYVDDAMNAAFARAAADNKARQQAAAERFMPTAGDLAKSFGRGINSFVNSSVALGLSNLHQMGPSELAMTFVNQALEKTLGKGARVMENPITAATRVAGEAAAAQHLEGTAQVDEALRNSMTLESRVNEQAVMEAMAADAAQNKAQFDQDMADSQNEVWAGTKRFGRGVADSVGNTLSNPNYLANAVAQQLPSLAAGGLGKAAVTQSSVRARAAQLLEEQGLKALDKKAFILDGVRRTTPEARRAAVRQAYEDLAVRNMQVVTGMMEAGGGYQQTQQEIVSMDDATFLATFPDAQELLDQGMTLEQAKRTIANEAGQTAAGIAGIAGAGIARIAGKFEIDPLHGSGSHALLTDVGKETAEEFLQSGASELAGNIGVRTQGGQNDLLEGVGEAAGQGGVLGGLMAGSTRTAGLTMEGVAAGVDALTPEMLIKLAKASANVLGPVLKATGSAVGTAVKAAGKAAEGRANKVRKAEETKAREQTTAANAVAAGGLRDAAEAAGIELDLVDPSAQLDEKALGDIANRTAVDLDALGVFTAINEEIRDESSGFEFSPNNKKLNFYVGALENMQRLSRQVKAQLEVEQDPDRFDALSQVDRHLTTLLDQSTISSIEGMKSVVPAMAQASMDVLTDQALSVGYDALDTNTRNAADTLKALVLTGKANNIPAQMVGKVRALYQKRMTPEENQAFEITEGVAKIRDAHQAEVAQRKSIKQVGTEIKSDGFLLNDKRLNSLDDFSSEVVNLLMSGQPKAAGEALKQLEAWAKHATGRVNAFNAAANAQIENFTNSGFSAWGPKTNLPYRQLTVDQQSIDVDAPAFVQLATKGGVELGRAMFEDAKAIVDTYNVLRSNFADGEALPAVEAPWIQAYDALPHKESINATPSQQPAATQEAEAKAGDQPTPAAPAEPQAKAEVPKVEVPAPAEAPAPKAQQVAEAEDILAQLEQKLAEANALLGRTEAPQIDFAKPSTVADEELQRVLDLSNEDYLNAVNPEGKDTSPATKEDKRAQENEIRDELEGVEITDSMPIIGKVPGTDIELRANGNYLYAYDPVHDLVVGQLNTTDNGSSLAVYPSPNYRNKGIGKALIRELLTRRPLAPSNGLSPGARATRLSVLRDLRAERNQPTFNSMEERFPGLVAQSPAGEGPRARNRFLSAFKLSKRSTSLFARVGIPLRAVRDAMTDSIKAIQSLIHRDANFSREVTEQDRTALQMLFGTITVQLADKINATLDADFQKNWARIEKSPWLWDTADRMAVHVGEIYTGDDGKQHMRMQQTILQAVIAGGFRWVIDSLNRPQIFREEDVAKLYPDGVIPPEALELHQNWSTYAAESAGLARTIMDVMGVSAVSSESRTSTNGLPAMLAGTFMEALAELKLGNTDVSLVETKILAPSDLFKEAEAHLQGQLNQPGAKKALATIHRRRAEMDDKHISFFRFPTLEDGNHAFLAKVSDLLGNSTELLDALFAGGGANQALIGKPARGVNSVVKGVNVAAGDAQTQMLKVLNRTPQYQNGAFKALLDQFDDVQQRRLFGEIDYTEENMGRAFLKNLRGWKLSAYRTRRELEKLHARVAQYGETAGLSPESVQVFWNYRINSNGRAEQQGFGGQNNKWARELYVPAMVTMDANDQQLRNELMLAIAQALDVKVENMLHQDAIDQVIAKLEGPLAPMVDLLTEPLDNPQQFVDMLLAAGFGNPARALNALHTYARFITSTEDTFTHGLVFEVDGKTDGPVNALMQFGLTHLGPKLLKQLAQGGLFLGVTEGGTLNENYNSANPDLYSNPVETWNEKMRELLNAGLPQEVKSAFVVTMAGLSRTGRLKFSTDGEGNTVFTGLRNLFKNPYTQKTYGAGDYSITRSMAKEIAGHYAQLIHEAVVKGELLAPELVAEIQTALGTAVYYDQESDSFDTSHTPVMPLRTLEDYKRFEIWPNNVDALVDTFASGAGKVLANALNDEVAAVNSNLDIMFKLTAMQSAALASRYNKRYNELRKQRVREGLIGPQDALSRDDEEALLAELKHLEPVFHTSQTKGGHGITLMKGFDSGALPVLTDYVDSDGKQRTAKGRDSRGTVQVTGAGGRFSSEVTVTFPTPDIGVRFAALLTIASGDAAMMGRVFQDMRAWFNVFDGLEVPVGQLTEASQLVNKAVWDNWADNLMGNLQEQIAKFEFDFAELSAEEQVALLERFRLPKKEQEQLEANAAARLQFFNSQLLLLRDRLDRAANVINTVKQIMSEIASSTDHMAGPMAPYVREGEQLTREQVLIYLRDEVSRRLGFMPETFQFAAEKDEIYTATGKPYERPVVENLDTVPETMTDPETQTVSMSADTLSVDELRAKMKGYKFKSKIPGYIYSKLESLLPKDLKIHVGTADQLRNTLRNQYPDFEGELGDALGMYLPGVVFVLRKEGGSLPAETLVHELIHAVTMGAIRDFYEHGGKRLTAGQRDAIRSLEKMVAFAIQLKPADAPAEFRHLQGVLKQLVKVNRMGDAVSELMAYSLSSPATSHFLRTQQGAKGVREIGTRLINFLRKLFGLAENESVRSFLAQTVDQFQRIVPRQVPDSAPTQRALFARPVSTAPTLSHSEHLQQLFANMNQLISTLPENGPALAVQRATRDVGNQYDQQEARMVGLRAAVSMVNANFPLDVNEQLAFSATHSVVTALSALDPLAISELQDLRTEAMKHLTEDDFLDVPKQHATSQDMTVARERLNALRFNSGPDLYGRSPLLANFVALAAVYEPLRNKLATLKTSSQKVTRDSFDELLRTGARKIFDVVGGKVLHTLNENQLFVVDSMLNRIAHATADHAARRPAPEWGIVGKAEKQIRKGFDRAYERLEVVSEGLANQRDQGDQRTLTAIKLLVSDMAAALISPEAKGDELATRFTRTLNVSKLPELMRALANEMMGTNAGNRDVHRLLNETKMRVSQIRQRLREQVPRIVEKLFNKPPTKAEMQLAYRTLGRTDVAALLDTHSMADIAKMLRDPAALQGAIQTLLGAFPAQEVGHLNAKAESLGQFLVTHSTVNQDRNMVRNAEALLLRTSKETGTFMPPSDPAEFQAMVDKADQLITLHALAALSPADKESTAALLEREPDAMEKTLYMLKEIGAAERKKHPDNPYRLNMWKGHLPSSMDPRKDLILAGPAYGAELLKRGYVLMRSYQADSHDRGAQDLAYYASKWSGGLSTYNQGALQTVENSLMGIDTLTGQTLDPFARSLIKHPDDVDNIVGRKTNEARLRGGVTGRGAQLLPIFNDTGDIVAYERPVDPTMLDQHTRQEGHLANAIGMWLGRQAEEGMAGELNKRVMEVLVEKYEQDLAEGRGDEYVRIDGGQRTKVVQESWNALPRQVQTELQRVFKQEGVWIRKDLLDNSIGYRTASVGDIFTGATNISPEMRKALENIAFALAGKHAYPLLVTGERAWQGLIGTAKDVIVVRSGIVAVANLLANQIQLLQMTGWNPARLMRVQLAKAKELEHYMRNQSRITELTAQLAYERDAGKIKQLQDEHRSLLDANSRLSIQPLLQAGMLPTIAEGLTEQDQYTLLHDGMRWIDERAQKLPKGVLTAAKYAVVAKDTALYQGLNRMVQFGDFMAKAALYEALMEQGGVSKNSDKEQAVLDEVNESFVNYNLLPGRGRDYLESMGVTWFWNYKLRIQKIALREFKRHPLRFLGMGVGAEWLGQDSLLSTSAPMVNMGYSIGPDQLWRAHEMLLWRQMW